MEQTISWHLLLWQWINAAVFSAFVFAVVKIVINSNETVKSLKKVEKGLEELSKKVDEVAKK